MAKRKSTKKTLQNEVKKVVRRKFGRRGGMVGLLFVALLFLIGFFNPELRDKILKEINATTSSTVLTEEDYKPLPSKTQSPLREGVWPVVHIADGDTLDVQDDEGTKHRIRLIGANTPETVKPNHPIEPFGPEASAFTKRIIAGGGDRVRVAFDGDQIDRYGRNLAMIYITLPEGEVWLNERLIREGLAKAELQYRFSKGAKQQMRQAQEEAQAARRGIWGSE